MALPFDPVWAVNGPVRAPTSGEQDEGFPCGALDRALFNFMFQDLQQAINAALLRAGQADIPVKGWQNTPPGSPFIGDKYIVNTTPTGAWVGHETEIAIWSGEAWVFVAPEAALQVQFRRGSLQVILEFDGTAWAEALFVRQVSVGPTIYVRTDGNDANDGSANDSAHAFATIRAAHAFGIRSYFLVGQTLTIQMGNAGTYAAPGGMNCASADVVVRGDPANPASYVISGSPANPAEGMISTANGSLTLNGVALANTTAGVASVAAGGLGSVAVTNVRFSTTAGVPTLLGASTGGRINIQAGCVIGGNADNMLSVTTGGSIAITSNVTVDAGLTFSIVALANTLGQIYATGSFSFIGSVVGQRYLSTNNSVINVGGSSTFFPGSTSGVTSNGGLYV